MCLSYNYAFDAAKLLNDCLSQIEEVIEIDELSRRGFHASSSALYDMKEALVQVERQLFCYFQYIIQNEVEKSSSPQVHQAYNQCRFDGLHSTTDFLSFVLLAESSASSNEEEPNLRPTNYYPRRSVTDSLLFRLNVALQLCLLRIDDSRSMITGRRQNDVKVPSSLVVPSLTSAIGEYVLPIAAAILGFSTLSLSHVRHHIPAPAAVIRTYDSYQPILVRVAQSGAALVALRWIHGKWSHLWMAMKLNRSTHDIEEWNTQWSLVQSTTASSTKRNTVPSPRPSSPQPMDDDSTGGYNHEIALDAARSQKLIEYALHDTPKVGTFLFFIFRLID